MPHQFSAAKMSDSVERAAIPALLNGQFAQAALTAQILAEDQHESLSDSSHVACGPGCDRCCVVNVSVLAPESDAIAEYLRQTLSPSALCSQREKLNTLYNHTRWLDDEERIISNHRCAFLDSHGSCSVYPVRPLLCRSVNSTNADDCRTAMSMLALGEQHPIVSNLVQKEIFESAFIGLGQALRTCGLDDRSFRLAGAVLHRLSDEKIDTET
jgi:Fe-S-cluster containining protein